MATYGGPRQGSIGNFFFEMREGLRRQGNVVFALIFKEIKNRAGADGYGLYSLLGIVLEPIIAVVSMMLFFYFIRRQEVNGVHVALFIAVSYIPFGIIRRSLTSIPRSLRSNSAFYAYQQVKPFDSVLSRFILEITLILSGGAILMFLLWWFMDLNLSYTHIPQAIGMVAMMTATGFGLSLFFGTYGTLYPVVNKIIQFVSRGLFILSAVIHPMSDLQKKAGDILLWNPLAHMEELLRYYALGMRTYNGVNWSYPLGFMLVSLFLGFIGYYANRTELLKR